MVSGTSLWHHTWFSIDLELIFDFMTYSLSPITKGHNSRNFIVVWKLSDLKLREGSYNMNHIFAQKPVKEDWSTWLDVSLSCDLDFRIFMTYFRNETKSTSKNFNADCMSRGWCWSILSNWRLWSKSFTWFSQREKAFWLLHPSRFRRFLFNACCSLHW